MEQHLHAFLTSFIAKRHRDNWLDTLARAKPNDNLLLGMDALYRELDVRYCTRLPKGNLQQDVAFVRRALAPYKIVTCYVLSADRVLNQQIMPVEKALPEIVGRSNTTIISFIPGRVAYFEGHSPGDRYWCIKEACKNNGN